MLKMQIHYEYLFILVILLSPHIVPIYGTGKIATYTTDQYLQCDFAAYRLKLS